MGRAPCCDKNGLKKGPWTPEEDQKLIDFIRKHGYGNWRTLPNNAGLQRCGKSCRLRWTNYLRPDIKRGRFSSEEEETIIQLHSILGNKWSAIASRLPGRTDNEIKNYWNTHIRKRLLRMGIDPVTHAPRLDLLDLSAILGSSLYGSSNMNMHRLLGMQQPLVNPELLKLASLALMNGQENQLCNNPQIRNQIPHLVQIQDPVQEVPGALSTPCVSLPFTQTQLVELEPNNVDPYPSNFTGFSSQQHPQLSDWHNSTGIVTEDYIPQLPSYNNNYYSSNNTNQNFSFPSVLSTPSSSPTPLNSNSTCINGSSTEDERSDSYGSINNVLRFEIPDILDVNEFVHVM